MFVQVRGLWCRLPCRVSDASPALPAMRAQRTAQEAGVILEETRPSRQPWWRGAGLLWAGHLRRFTASGAWAHCTNEVQVLLYPLRTRFRALSVEVLRANWGTEAFLFFYILPHLREIGTETIIQLPESRGFIMIPIYPSLSSTKWQPGPTDKYRQSTLTHLHINTLPLTDVK